MNPYKSLLYLFVIFDLFIINSAYIQVYNTENTLAIQSYDCIHYTNVTAINNETTPYCIRTNESVTLNRSFSTSTCENSGKEWNFRSLKDMNISQDEVLTWSSSIEMADRYAAYLRMGQEQLADDKICNCSSKTFGKFCEYEFMTMNTFEETIQYQFNLKFLYRIGSQLWGNITCYTTLINCYFGLRCLTWHNICDGKQQCMDGIDEDHCEELEYNECEENEYRCEDGSCIPEQYWLDGTSDCSDRSDEQVIGGDFLSVFCPLTSSQLICDETMQYLHYFACGDGQFTLEISTIPMHCYNYRNIMFFCELQPYSLIFRNRRLWTLENGNCIDKGQISKNLNDMNELEKCVFYLKCKLSSGRATGCDDVISVFDGICKNKTINYPSEPVFNPYAQTVYQLSELKISLEPNYVYFNGSIKCIGYQARSSSQNIRFGWLTFQNSNKFDHLFCNYSEKRLVSGPQIDKHCWNETKQSFLCQKSFHCISKHRLKDGVSDCMYTEDENNNQQCYIKKRHRFHCSKKSTCLLISNIGTNGFGCDEHTDKYIKQLKWDLRERRCTTPNSIECKVLRAYIQSPLSPLTINNNEVLLFRQYCNSVWDLPRGFDESLCKKWKCPKDFYQCLTGHCIPIHRVLRFTPDGWNCPDASDRIDRFEITQLSEHNVKLISSPILKEFKDRLIYRDDSDSLIPFIKFCKTSKEYGCILANVSDPLNFTINRPCINMTQIGDGIIDCYGGLDERNLLTCGDNLYDQRGFDFHCSDQECIPYGSQCETRCLNKADSLLCDQLKTLWDSSCEIPKRIDLCYDLPSFYEKCDLFRSQKYYCDTQRSSDSQRFLPYRYESWAVQIPSIYLPEYPLSKEIQQDHHDIQSTIHETINVYFDNTQKDENVGREGWICGRGVAVQTNKMNKIRCFCPPSLYGEYCQYFSDRITVIISINNIREELLEQPINAIKILALFLSNDIIIDHHIVHLPLIFSKEFNKKFRFNLIHQRPKLFLNSFTVRFELYHLSINSSISFLAVWEYPIEFSFLPSYRLVKILNFEKESLLISKEHICKKSNPCLHNSTCYSIMNKINNTSIYYCHCNNQTFGKYCQYFQQSIITSKCSKNALLRLLSSSKSICLCPIHSYGPKCYLNYTCANKNPCGIDRGKCYINSDNTTRDYICICDKKFFGDHCEFNSSMVRINFTDFSFVQTPSNFILSSIIQLFDIDNETLNFLIRQKRVYQGLPPSITEIYHNDHRLPRFGIMKLYHKQNLSNDYIANLKQHDYFILYIISSNISRMNFTMIINRTNYCPYTPIAFHQNISNISFLSQLLISNQSNINNNFNFSEMIFEYHLLCNLSLYSLMCFHDDNYICICDEDYHAECFRYDSTLDKCNKKCLYNGQCIHGDLDNRTDFVCLCPHCYYGSICQHNTELFSFTLETLLTSDLYSPSVHIQRLFFGLFIIIPSILFLIGLISNVCSYVTFNRKKPLIVGIGHYLRTATIINQLTLFILLLKLLHLVLSIRGYIVHHLTNTILCKILSYLLSCSCRMSYWLMGMVAIERVYVTWNVKGTWLKSPRIAKWIIAIIIIGIAVCDAHELIYYESIEDPKSPVMNLNSTLCITSYSSGVTTYNQVNIILNYIMPFLINLLSTIIIIILIIQRRVAVTAEKKNHSSSTRNVTTTWGIYLDLWVKNKDLILPPLATIVPQLFSLPQLIISFSLSCQEFQIDWKRYLLIISYFTLYLPQVLSFKLYVSPSSFYKEEFHATKLNKRISQLQAFITRKKTSNALNNIQANKGQNHKDF